MLEVTSLTRAYGSHLAIADVTLRVGDGELLTIVGPSGCGKSTLLRCVAGLLPPTSGRVVLSGGMQQRAAIARALARIVRAVKDKHPEVTVGLHICRGNARSSWVSQGSYKPVVHDCEFLSRTERGVSRGHPAR